MLGRKNVDPVHHFVLPEIDQHLHMKGNHSFHTVVPTCQHFKIITENIHFQ